MLLALTFPAFATPDCTGSVGVTVNELATQTGAEFIELYNAGGADVSLDEWTLEWGRDAYDDDLAIPAGTTLAPDAWWVVGSPGAAYKDLEQAIDLGNATSNADAVRLACDGAVVDTVVYGTSNADAWTDDTGITATSLAPKPDSSESIMRYPDGGDTDASAVDFHVADVSTPGAANTSGGGTTVDADCTGAEGVKVNEIAGATNFEFIELYNAGSADVALGDWVLDYGSSSLSASVSIPAGTTLAPGAWWVVGNTGATYKDLEQSMNSMGNSAGAVRLSCKDVPYDTVVYGSSNSGGFVDDTGAVATSLAPGPSDGSIMRYPDGADTDQSGVDFHAAEVSTPGAANTEGTGTPAEADCTGAEGLKINEFAVQSSPEPAEYIELYNAGTLPVALGGWVLEFGSSTYSKDESLPVATLAPGDWWTIGTTTTTPMDYETRVDLGNAEGALRLVCNGAPVDTVVYGSPVGFLDDTGQAASSFAPTPGDGAAASRVQDGYDTEQSGLDFGETTPSPGGANPFSEPPVCEVAGGDDIKINEFISNPGGADTDLEWVELYNAGNEPYRVDGWTIATAGSETFGVDYTFPGGTELAPGAFLVVGGSSVDEADFVAVGFSIGNGTEGDGLQLANCEGAVVDTVLYGDEMEDGLVDDNGGSLVVKEVTEDASIGRYPDGEETESAEDWHTYTSPTPGAPNGEPGAGGDTGGPGGGCGDRPDSKRPGGACTSIPGTLPLGGLEIGLLALVALRRRRA